MSKMNFNNIQYLYIYLDNKLVGQNRTAPISPAGEVIATFFTRVLENNPFERMRRILLSPEKSDWC